MVDGNFFCIQEKHFFLFGFLCSVAKTGKCGVKFAVTDCDCRLHASSFSSLWHAAKALLWNLQQKVWTRCFGVNYQQCEPTEIVTLVSGSRKCEQSILVWIRSTKYVNQLKLDKLWVLISYMLPLMEQNQMELHGNVCGTSRLHTERQPDWKPEGTPQRCGCPVGFPSKSAGCCRILAETFFVFLVAPKDSENAQLNQFLRISNNIWKVPNHNRDMAKRCIPQMRSSNVPSGQWSQTGKWPEVSLKMNWLWENKTKTRFHISQNKFSKNKIYDQLITDCFNYCVMIIIDASGDFN